jgi:hypothetical protein
MAPRCPKMRVGSRLGLHFYSFWALSGPQDGQDRRREPQVGTKMGQVGRKITNLRPHLDHFSVSWRWFFEKRPRCENEQPSISFDGFLKVRGASGGSWRLSWEGFGSYVGRCWLQDGVFQAILGYVMASWSQDEPTGAQKSESSRICGGRLEPRTGGTTQSWEVVRVLALGGSRDLLRT